MRRASVVFVGILAAFGIVAGLVAIVMLLTSGGSGTTSGSLTEDPLADPSAGATTGSVPVVDDEAWGTVEVYDVLDDGTLDPAPVDALAAEIWETFRRVATPDFAAEVIIEYRVGNAPESDMLAYVYQDESAREYWILAANRGTSTDPATLIPTLIHEYAHILSLGVDQTEPADACPTVETSEGCAFEDSYLAAFHRAFWAPYGPEAPAPDNDDASVAKAFYAAHAEDFVSDYATTNVVEDLAESFTAFVLEPRPADEAATTVASKIGFFWRYPELETIRERVRAEFSDVLSSLVY